VDGAGPDREPQLTNAGMVQLRVRVIALENLVIALLAGGSDRQGAREMAGYISPWPGFTQHQLTRRAAAHMIDRVERAAYIRCAGVDTLPLNPPADHDD
jgi:hypothetical protein